MSRVDESVQDLTKRFPHRDPFLSSENLGEVLSVIKFFSGIDLSMYKEGTIRRRIKERIRATKSDSAEAYVQKLKADEYEVSLLLDEMLIGVTDFFRDSDAFSVIREEIIPELCRRESAEPLRIWVIGCSTGQEAYSLAMAFSLYIESHGLNVKMRIFATDINRRSVDFAQNGIYPEEQVAGLSEIWLSRYFTKKPYGYAVSDKLKRNIAFSFHDITGTAPFRSMDLITCRNLLIYLKPELQKEVFRKSAFL